MHTRPWQLPKPAGRSGAKLILIHWNPKGNYKEGSAEKTIGQWPCIVCICVLTKVCSSIAMVCLITNRCWKLRHGSWIDQTIWKNIWRLRPTFPGSWWIHNLAKRSSKYGRQGVKAWQRGDFHPIPICLNRIFRWSSSKRQLRVWGSLQIFLKARFSQLSFMTKF